MPGLVVTHMKRCLRPHPCTWPCLWGEIKHGEFPYEGFMRSVFFFFFMMRTPNSGLNFLNVSRPLFFMRDDCVCPCAVHFHVFWLFSSYAFTPATRVNHLTGRPHQLMAWEEIQELLHYKALTEEEVQTVWKVSLKETTSLV